MIPLTIKILVYLKVQILEKMAEIFFSDSLIKSSWIRISRKKFLDDHRPPSGQGKLTFNYREDTAPGGRQGGSKFKAFLHRYLRNKIFEFSVAKSKTLIL